MGTVRFVTCTCQRAAPGSSASTTARAERNGDGSSLLGLSATVRSSRLSPALAVASPALLITASTQRTATGRRRYYDEATSSLSDGRNTRKACVVCGKVRKSRGATCRDCYMQARASTYVDLACSSCGTKFRQMRAEVEKRKRRGQENFYCAPACVKVALSQRFVRGCAECGGKIPNPNGRMFCSTACRNAARSLRHQSKVCTVCGTVFRPRSSRHQYCDRQCANAAHSSRMVGSGNSHFKDGTSYAEWFRQMRPLIMERDLKQCVVCSTPDKPHPVTRNGKTTLRSNLVVHHINEDPQNNRPQNLITLCKACHAVHHKSATTPYPWFATYTAYATRFSTSKWKATATSLRKKFSSTTA